MMETRLLELSQESLKDILPVFSSPNPLPLPILIFPPRSR
jgi:hypothetical protein